MLELRTGEPRWYKLAVAGAVMLLLAALVLNRVQYEYAGIVLLCALIIVGLDCRARKRRGEFERLRVGRDISLALSNNAGEEFVAECAGRCWVSSRMIIIPLRSGSSGRINIVISREGNDHDAFRRFAVICRFGFAVDGSERHNVAEFNPQGSMK